MPKRHLSSRLAMAVMAAFAATALLVSPLSMTDAVAKSSPSSSSGVSTSRTVSGFTKPSTTTVAATNDNGGFKAKTDTASKPIMGFTKPSTTPAPAVNDNKAPDAKPATVMGFKKPDQGSSTAPVAAATTPTDTNKPVAVGGFVKPTSADSKPVVGQAAPMGAAKSSLDIAASKNVSKSALAKFDSDQKKFSAPPPVAVDRSTVTSNPVWASNASRYRTADDYYAARDRSYASLHYQPPVIVYQHAPSYGLWDTVFLYMMLDRISQHNHDYAMWAYSHQTDPGYQAWMRDAQNSNDAKVQAQLADLKAEVARLEAEKAQQNPAFLPSEVDASVALAPQAVLSAQANESEVAPTKDEPAYKSNGGIGVVGVIAILLVLGGLGGLGWAGWKMFGPRK
jgi:hypothetical protein